MELSPCLELLFTEAGADIGDRVRAAHAAGYSAGEIWSWREKDLDALERALQDTGMALQTMCTDPMTRIVDPSTHQEFLAGLQESIGLAERLHSPYLVVTAGDELPGVPRAEQRAAVVAVLQRAAALLAGHPVTLLLENLNSRVDHVGTFCDSTADVVSILREVNSPQVRLLYDAYHSLVMDEDPVDVLAGNMDLLGHIQIADAPGRHQPGSGQHDWAGLLGLFSRLGYRGRIGLEYRPTGDTINSLTDIRKIADAA
jgi:hydroxypyruvate isomerase